MYTWLGCMFCFDGSSPHISCYIEEHEHWNARRVKKQAHRPGLAKHYAHLCFSPLSIYKQQCCHATIWGSSGSAVIVGIASAYHDVSRFHRHICRAAVGWSNPHSAAITSRKSTYYDVCYSCSRSPDHYNVHHRTTLPS
jgi:hypothetical protein